MRDKKLRREAMVKRYTLQQLLEHAANKEDIDRQVQDMEQKLAPVPDQVNRIQPKKTRKPSHRRTTRNETHAILLHRPQRAKIKLSRLWKNMCVVFKKRSFCSHV